MPPRLFITFLAPLLCVIAARADKPIVIKESESIQYVGKEGEVHGRVVSVTTSPTGDDISKLWKRIPETNVRWIYFGRVQNSG